MSAPWMDAAFALDELHCEPGFAKAAVDGMQQRKVLADGGSDLEMISAFLDEMAQLDMEQLVSFENAASDATWQSFHQHPDPPALSANAAATAAPVRKKKMSSTERRKRDKAELLERLVQLELQLQGHQTDKQQLDSQFDNERQREQRETHRVLDRNLRIRQALTLEQDRSSEVTTLLNQLRAPMQV